MRLLFMLAVLCIAVTGCESGQVIRSSRDTMSVSGPAVTPSSTAAQSLPALFQLTYQNAYEAQVNAYNGVTAGSQERFRNMAEVGFGLVRAHCAEFFSNRGESQKWIQFSADLVALGGALATGLLAITGTSALAVSIVALSSATAFSSIDVYTKNFLFGAENIDAVRVLIMDTLGADATTSLRTPIGEWSFAYAVNAIMANQEICKPARILALTRNAIATSTVKAAPSSGVDEMDTLRKESIGLLARPAGIRPSETEVAALCWAADYKEVSSATDKEAIRSNTKNFPKGPNTPGDWDAIKGKVRELCRALSPAAQAYIDQQIVEMQTKGGGAASTPAAPAAAPVARQTGNTILLNNSKN